MMCMRARVQEKEEMGVWSLLRVRMYAGQYVHEKLALAITETSACGISSGPVFPIFDAHFVRFLSPKVFHYPSFSY